MTGVAPERPDLAVARVLAGGLTARVAIDPNVRLGRSRTFTGFDDCDRIPAIGEHVTVHESEAGIEGPAVVTGIDEGKRLVYLDVDWAALVCATCLNHGVVCENHPDRPREGTVPPPAGCDRGGAGMPCPRCCDPVPLDGRHAIAEAFTPRHLRANPWTTTSRSPGCSRSAYSRSYCSEPSNQHPSTS